MTVARLTDLGPSKIHSPRALSWLRSKVSVGPAFFVVALLALIAVPLVFTVIVAFRGPVTLLPFSQGTHYTAGNISAALGNGLGETLWNTVEYVGPSVVLAMVVGAAVAFALTKLDVPARRVLRVMLFLPLAIAPITNAQVWSELLSPDTGMLNRLIRLVLPFHYGPLSTGSLSGLVFAQGLSVVPYVALFLAPAMENVSRSLEEAGEISGATSFEIVRTVTLPVIRPALLSTSVLLVLLMVGSFEIPLVFGSQAGVHPIALQLYNLLNPVASSPDYGVIAAFSLVLTLITFGLIVLYGKLVGHQNRFQTVAGKGSTIHLYKLRKWRWPIFAALCLYEFVTVGLPLWSLIAQSLVPALVSPMPSWVFAHMSLAGFQVIWHDAAFWGGLKMSLTVAGVSTIVTTVVGVGAAWVVVRFKGNAIARRILDTIGSASLGISPPVAAFAFLMAFLTINRVIPIYGTTLGLCIAYSFRVGFTFRLGNAAVHQVSVELEDAATIAGARRFTVFRTIVVPLILPTIIMLVVFGVITAVQEFTVPLFLAGPSAQPLSVYAYDQIGAQNNQSAAAVGLVMLAMVLIVAFGGVFVEQRAARRRS